MCWKFGTFYKQSRLCEVVQNLMEHDLSSQRMVWSWNALRGAAKLCRRVLCHDHQGFEAGFAGKEGTMQGKKEDQDRTGCSERN